MEAFKEYLSNGGLEFLLPARAEDAGFKRTPVSQAAARNPEREAMVRRMASGIAGTWANPPKVEYFNSLQDANIPESARKEDAKQRANGSVGGIEGFYLGGVVYVNLGLKKPEDVVRVMAHEALGHYGLRGLFGKGLKDVLDQIVATRKADVLAKAEEYGLDAKDPDDVLIAAEEVLAEMAQNKPELGFVKRAIASIRSWLRANLPGFGGMKLSDAEIIAQFILPARAFVEQGSSAGKEMAAEANPDIRFSREKPAEPTGLTPNEQGKFRKFQAEFQDNNNRIKQVQERISGIAGTKVPEYADYYMAETNRPGRIAARLEDFRKKMQAPLVERIAKSGNTIAQVEELAHAMHALERNRAIAKINPKHDPDSKEFIGVEGSGMNTDVAADIMDKYKYDKALQQHVKDLQGIARATLDIKLASGRLGRDQYDAYTNAYDFYVPLKGDGEYGPNVKRAMGHESRDEHVVENVMRDYEQAVVTAERNLSRQSLLQLVLGNPDSKLWTVGVTPKGRYVAGQVFTIVKGNEEIASFTSQSQVDAFMEAKGSEAFSFDVLDERGDRVKEFAKPLQANEVPVYIDGQRVRIQINDETLAGQLRPMDQKQMSWVRGKFNSVQRYLSRIYTAYSPTFIITNPLRDVQTGTINMLGNQGASVAAKAWTKYPGALKALAKFAATGQEPGGDTGRMLKEYRMNGGKTGASHMSDLEDQGKTLQRLYDDAYGASGYMADGKVGKAAVIAGRKMLMSLAHVIEVTNQATENALRLSLYMTLREGGSTPGVAAQAAKNVTVNFDRKGNQAGVMGALYLFFNPAVQGTANAMRTLFHGEHKKQAWAALSALAMLGMWAASQGIDDDEDRWLGEDWDVRSKKLVMNIGGKKIVVPLSLEFAPFFAAGVALEEARRGAVTKTEATGRLLSSFIDAYVPFKGLFSYDSDNKPLDAVTALTPTLLRPFVESAINRNAFGSKIVPENEFTKDRPDSLKMNRNTKGTLFDSAAQGIALAGEAAGAGRYENDITKVSPEMLRHWWRTYTGGLGTFIADMGGLAKLGAEDPTVIEMADVPVLKAFAKGQDVAPIRGRFYDLSKDARAASTEFKQAKKAGDDEAIDAILNNPSKAELLGMERLISKTTKAAAALRDEMVDINADKAMALAEKRAALKALEKDEEELYRSAIGAFK
jgi:Large polyvalent protein associated domain 38